MHEFHLHLQGLQRMFKNHVLQLLCVAYDVYMPLNYPWSLLVIVWLLLVPINITGIRGEPTVLEGDNLHLTCEALSRLKPNITWTKEKPGNQGNTGVVQEGKVLNVTNIKRTDAGTFTCTAYNGFGKPEKRTVYVNVTCEYALKKHWLIFNRDALSIYFLCCNVIVLSITFIDVWLSTSMQGSKLNFSKKSFNRKIGCYKTNKQKNSHWREQLFHVALHN